MNDDEKFMKQCLEFKRRKNMKESIDYAFRVTHLGGPTIIIEIGGLHIIPDPSLDEGQ
jgi:hypothetical protein